MAKLTFTNHSRQFNDFFYIYPVLSRRSQGLSLGINLNVNNACNWRCIYCQVENLVRGKPDDIDLEKLEFELDYMLNEIVNGDFIKKMAPVALQRFNDISLSGNGEPTLSKQFLQVVEIIAKLRQKYNLGDKVKTILITNGSEIDRGDVLAALQILSWHNPEIWFKVDCVSEAKIQQINQVNLSIEGIIKRLTLAAGICKTYIQTCLFKINQENPSEKEIELYLEFLAQVKSNISGVLLYSIARNPALLEGKTLSRVSEEYLKSIAARISSIGINVKFYE